MMSLWAPLLRPWASSSSSSSSASSLGFVRHYVKNFWERDTRIPGLDARFGDHQNHFKGSKNVKVREYFPRPSEIKRLRKGSFAMRMSYANGRKMLMKHMLEGRKQIADF